MTARRLDRWVLALAALVAGCHRPVESGGVGGGEALRTQAVKHGDIAERVVLTGEVHAEQSHSMVVPRTDQMPLAIRFMAEDGKAVTAGDKVLEFDNSAFTKALEEKRLAVLEAEMNLKAAEDISAMETATKSTELRQHQIAFDKATVKASVPAELLSEREAQDRLLDKRRMEVQVKKAEEALAAQKQEAALDLQVKRIDLDKAKRAIGAAEQTIADLVLTAPRDGVIVVETHPWEGRKFHTGDTVQAGMTIITMPDLARPMEVHAELSDVDDGRLSVGMKGNCTMDAYPTEPVPCSVKEIAPVARTKGENSLRRAFAAVVTLEKTDATRMRPGMSVKVELRRPTASNVVVVPRAALVEEVPAKEDRLAAREARDERDAKIAPAAVLDAGVTSADGKPAGGDAKAGGDPKAGGNAKAGGEAKLNARGGNGKAGGDAKVGSDAKLTAGRGNAKLGGDPKSTAVGSGANAGGDANGGHGTAGADTPVTDTKIVAPPTPSRAAKVRLANGDTRDIVISACDAQGCAVERGLSDGDTVIVGGGS